MGWGGGEGRKGVRVEEVEELDLRGASARGAIMRRGGKAYRGREEQQDVAEREDCARGCECAEGRGVGEGRCLRARQMKKRMPARAGAAGLVLWVRAEGTARTVAVECDDQRAVAQASCWHVSYHACMRRVGDARCCTPLMSVRTTRTATEGRQRARAAAKGGARSRISMHRKDA